MNKGVQYRYFLDSEEEEEAPLAASQYIHADVLKEYHDLPISVHCGAKGTSYRIVKRYDWVGMRKDIVDYVKGCSGCCHCKAYKLKQSQRFETLSLDFFCPVPKTPSGEKWILILQDFSTKWTELFLLKETTDRGCTTTLLEEVALRFKFPREITTQIMVLSLQTLLCNSYAISSKLTNNSLLSVT